MTDNLFYIKYYEVLTSIPQDDEKNSTSFEVTKHIRVKQQVIDMQNLITYLFIDKDGKPTAFSYVPNEGFACAIYKK